MTEWLGKLDEVRALMPEGFGWILEVFVVIFLALLTKLVLNRFFDRLASRFEHTNNRWDDTLLEAARRPATMMVWAVGLFWALEIVQQETDSALFEIVDPGRRVAVIGLLAWFLPRTPAAAKPSAS